MQSHSEVLGVRTSRNFGEMQFSPSQPSLAYLGRDLCLQHFKGAKGRWASHVVYFRSVRVKASLQPGSASCAFPEGSHINVPVRLVLGIWPSAVVYTFRLSDCIVRGGFPPCRRESSGVHSAHFLTEAGISILCRHRLTEQAMLWVRVCSERWGSWPTVCWGKVEKFSLAILNTTHFTNARLFLTFAKLNFPPSGPCGR